jgi:TolB protein
VFGLTGIVGPSTASAETDIRITGATAGFPVAIPRLCDAGAAGDPAAKISEVIAKDLDISGLFKVINPSAYVEAPGKCEPPDKVAYSDWSVIGAEGLVKGEVRNVGGSLEVRMYLHDVQQQRAVIGKRYEAGASDYARIAHKFSNEILRYFTGEPGIFGTRIAYVSRVGRFKELFIMDMDGSNVRQLTRDNGLAMSPSWSPSGDRLVYTSYRSRKPDLYFISPEGGGLKQLTARQGLEIGAKFSPDGRSVVTSAAIAGVSKIVQLDFSGRLLRKLTGGSDAIDVSPTFSPDGSKIAFCSNRAGGPQIYVMSSSGEPATRISFTNSNYCTSPAWSPKGDKIVFVCRAGGNQLFISSPTGGQVTQLTFAGDNEDPTWSPDGRFLAFSSNLGSGPRNIAILSLLGGSPHRISFARSEDSQPTWSPLSE